MNDFLKKEIEKEKGIKTGFTISIKNNKNLIDKINKRSIKNHKMMDNELMQLFSWK